jgi:histidyl-tRNA synthetase
MWTFQDKGGRDVCLIPEATGIIQELYRERWERSLPKPIRLFYITRCYRYERPQAGRYREFTQVGVEILGPETPKEEAVAVLRNCLDDFGLVYRFVPAVKRGLTYYVEDGSAPRSRSPAAADMPRGSAGRSGWTGCCWRWTERGRFRCGRRQRSAPSGCGPDATGCKPRRPPRSRFGFQHRALAAPAAS